MKGYKVIIIMINIIIKTKMLKMMVVFMIIVKNLPRANDGDHGFVIIMTRVVHEDYGDNNEEDTPNLIQEVRRGLTEARELVARQKRDRQSMDRSLSLIHI